jgi:hypothetical protein
METVRNLMGQDLSSIISQYLSLEDHRFINHSMLKENVCNYAAKEGYLAIL